MAHRRPSSELKSIVIYNTKDDEGNWIPMTLSINSMVTMRPLQIGKHKVKKKYFFDVKYHWKGMIKEFKTSPGGKKVSEVKIAHVYDKKEIMKESIAEKIDFFRFGSNCLYISNWEEWEPIESITSTFQAIHFEVGEIIYAGKDSTWLIKQGIWFYKYTYILPRTGATYGKLEEIPLPMLNSLGWPNIDPSTIASYCYKNFEEVQAGMKLKGGNHVNISVFMPINIFCHMFKIESSIQRTKKTYSIQSPSDRLLKSLFCFEWDKRVHYENGEEIECRLSHDTISFRYWISRQILYMRFQFRRWRHVYQLGQWTWIPNDQDENDGTHSPKVSFDILMNKIPFRSLSMEENWTLFEVRKYLEMDEELSDFIFLHNGNKVGKRRENIILCKDCLPPTTLEIKEN